MRPREFNCDRGKNKRSGNESPSCSRWSGREDMVLVVLALLAREGVHGQPQADYSRLE